MPKSLIEYYENELNFLNDCGKELSVEFPHISNNLDFSNNSNDPDIKKLIESVALLNAKLTQSIEENSVKSTYNILYSLFPEFQKPIPSCSIAAFQSNTTNFNKKTIPSNTSLCLNNKSFVLNYKFKTIFEVNIASFIITSAVIVALTESDLVNVCEAIQIDIKKIANFDDQEIIVHINASNIMSMDIYQAINCTNLKQNIPIFEDNKQIGEMIPFHYDSNLLSYEDNTSKTQTLYFETSAYINKFYFFKIKFFQQPKKHILIPYYSKKNIVLKKDYFVLNCSPIVNLIQDYANPIKIDQQKEKYPINLQPLYVLYKINEIKNQKDQFVYNYLSHHNQESKMYWLLKNEICNNKRKNYIELINDNFQEQVLFLKTTTAQMGAENIAPYNEWNIESNPGNVVCYNITRPTKIQYFDQWNNETVWRLITLLRDDIFVPNLNLKNKFIDLFLVFNNEDKISKILQYIINIQFSTFLTNYLNYIVEKHYFIIQADLEPSGVYLMCEIIANIILKQRKINTLIQVDLFDKNNMKIKEWKVQ